MRNTVKILLATLVLCSSQLVRAQISGPSQVCSGAANTYTYTGGQGLGYVYLWSVTGGGGFTGLCSIPCTARDITFSGSGGTITLEVKDGKSGPTIGTYTKVVTISNPVTSSNVNGDIRCGAGSIQVSVSNPSGTYQWYNSSSGGSPITNNVGAGITISGSGGSVLSVNNLTATKTYYVEEATCNTSRIPVTATINPLPTQYSLTGGGAFCTGGTGVAIGLSDSQSGVSYQLKRGSTNVGSPVSGTNNAISFGNHTTAGTYTVYGTRTSTGCARNMTGSKVVSTDPVTVAGTVAGSSNRCGSGTVSYTLSGHTGTIQRWQSRYKNGSGSWTGWSTITETDNTTSVTPSLAQWSGGQRTYEVRATIKSGTCTTLYSTKQTTVDPSTVGGTVSGSSTKCGSGSSTFSIAGHTGTIQRWQSRYRNGSGSWTGWSLITETDNVTSVSPTVSQWSGGQRTYEVRATVKSGSGCSTLYPSKTMVVDRLTVAGTVSGSTSRCGSGSTNYTISGQTGTIQRWQSRYRNGSGSWTSWSTITETDNITSVSPNLSEWSGGARTYEIRATIKSGVCSTLYSVKQTTINPIPGLASGSNVARCGPGAFSVVATPGSNANSIRWYSGPSGGSAIHTGTTHSGTLSATSTFYAASFNSSTLCEDTDRHPITVTINPIPGLASGSDVARCGQGVVTLTASPGSNGTSIRWYTASTGGTQLHPGSSFTTPSLSSSTTYYAASYNLSTGCESINRHPITATIVPLVGSATISSGVSTRCQGSGTTDYNASASNAVGYTWSISPSSAGTINSSGLVTWGSEFSGSATVSVTVLGGCNSTSANRSVTVTPLVGSTTISSGVSSRCQGSGTTDYNVSASNASSYSWSISPASAGTINSSGLVTWDNGFSGTATVSATASGSCNSTSANRSVTVTPLVGSPTISSGVSTRCQGSGTTDYNVSASNASSYSWSISPASAGTINSSGLVTWDNGFSGIATVSVTASGSCNSTSANRSVTVTPLVGTPTISSGVSARCQGSGTTDYNVSAPNATSYTWSISPSTAGTIDSSSGLVTWNSGFSGDATVTVTATGSCNNTSINKLVKVWSLVGSTTISSGVSTRCQGSGTTDYNANASDATSYTWSISPSSAGSINSSGLVTWDNGFSGTATVSVTASGLGSCNSTSANRSVTVTPLVGSPTISSGVSTRCQGSGTTDYNVSAPNATSYSWSISPASAGTINSSGLVTWDIGFSGTAIVSATALGSCNSTSANMSVTVTPLVGSPTISSGVSTRCQGSGTTDYNVIASNATSYSWSISPASAGTINSSGLVTWDNGFSGTATVSATASGSCNSTSADMPVTVTPLVGSATISSGVSTRCQGSGTTDYNASASTATSYTWSISPSSAGTINSTSGLVTWNSSFSGTATVSVTASGSCGSTSANMSVTVTPLVGFPSISSGVSTRCQGSGTTDYNASASNATSYTWTISPSAAGTINSSGLVTWNSEFSGIATVSVTALGSCNSASVNRSITVDGLSLGGNLLGSVEEFGVASGTLILAGQTGAINKWQYKTTGVWEDLLHTGTSFTYMNVQEPTSYRVEVQNSTCTVANSNEVLINVLNVPSMDLGLTQSIRPGQSNTLTADAGHANYEWFKNGLQVQTGSSNQYLVEEPGTYFVTVTSSGGAIYTTGDAIIASQLEMDQNSVLTFSFREEVLDDSNLFDFDTDQMSISASVVDGLGRPIQQVSLSASPSGHDLVSVSEFDPFGRQVKNYLSYADGNTAVLFKPTALASQFAFYSNPVGYNDTRAFAETRYESSPLGRVEEQIGPGDAWQNAPVEMNYSYNKANDVLKLTASGLMSLSVDTYYDATELYRQVTIDEDGNQTEEFTDKVGLVVLKRNMVEVVSNDTVWAETYYVYDVYNRLAIVLPPEGVANLSTQFYGETVINREAFLAAWAFQYSYDGHGRMTSKQVPGAEKVLLVYDRWDRLVLTQDGNQRAASPAEWLFTKYDVLNRPIVTGIMTSTDDEATIRSTVAAFANRAESFEITGINQYTDTSYPSDALVTNYLTVTYYDDYDFQSHTDWVSLNLGFDDPADPDDLLQNTAVNGQVTGVMTKVGDGTWIRSVSYYDDRYRLIQSASTNHLGGKDVVTNYYDFIGQVTKTVSAHEIGAAATVITRRFEYDHVGRLLKTFHQIGSDPEVQIAENNYNEIGELIEKNLHQFMPSAGPPEYQQSIDYSYNIRGWLRSINQPGLSSSPAIPEPTDLFNMELIYNGTISNLPNN